MGDIGNQAGSHSINIVIASSKLIHRAGPNDTRAQKHGKAKHELGYALSLDSRLLLLKHPVLALPGYPLLPSNTGRPVV
jgi:hypothetical protein